MQRKAPQSPANAGAWPCLGERTFWQAVLHSGSVSSLKSIVSFPKCHTRSKAFLKSGYVSFQLLHPHMQFPQQRGEFKSLM